MNAIQRLIDAGLIVEPSRGRKKAFSIAKPKPKSTDSLLEQHTHYLNNIPIVDTVIHLVSRDSEWFLEHIDHIPYPGQRDFSCAFNSLDEAVVAAIAFYFGEPAIIDNWVAPLRRHPELQVEGIECVLLEAVHTTPEDFAEIKARHWEEFAGRMKSYKSDPSVEFEQVWQQVYSHQFLEIPHFEDTTRILQLRRDMQEAYIVHKG